MFEYLAANICLNRCAEFLTGVHCKELSGIEMSDEFIAAGRIDDFPGGKLRRVEVAGEGVVLANVRGRIYTISNCCTDRGVPLAEGGQSDRGCLSLA